MQQAYGTMQQACGAMQWGAVGRVIPKKLMVLTTYHDFEGAV
jgi:hypothetical protein